MSEVSNTDKKVNAINEQIKTLFLHGLSYQKISAILLCIKYKLNFSTGYVAGRIKRMGLIRNKKDIINIPDLKSYIKSIADKECDSDDCIDKAYEAATHDTRREKLTRKEKREKVINKKIIVRKVVEDKYDNDYDQLFNENEKSPTEVVDLADFSFKVRRNTYYNNKLLGKNNTYSNYNIRNNQKINSSTAKIDEDKVISEQALMSLRKRKENSKPYTSKISFEDKLENSRKEGHNTLVNLRFSDCRWIVGIDENGESLYCCNKRVAGSPYWFCEKHLAMATNSNNKTKTSYYEDDPEYLKRKQIQKIKRKVTIEHKKKLEQLKGNGEFL